MMLQVLYHTCTLFLQLTPVATPASATAGQSMLERLGIKEGMVNSGVEDAQQKQREKTA